MSLTLMYITNNPQVAVIAQKYGVDRIWVDLETLGKEERQGHIDSVKSHHSVDDIKKIVPLLDHAEMLVRVNPLNAKSEEEINAVIDAGADLVMLPMWKNAKDVKKFIKLVGGRAGTILLLETKEAVESLDEVLNVEGIDEIHIGLNDLHLSYNMHFMFEPLADGMVEKICKKISNYNIPYGFGGIAKLGYGDLPAENIIQEHYRLGSTRAILSRSFCNTEKISSTEEIENAFSANMKSLREYEKIAENLSAENYLDNKKIVIEKVNKIKQARMGA